jgi:hypothetical protein
MSETLPNTKAANGLMPGFRSATRRRFRYQILEKGKTVEGQDLTHCDFEDIGAKEATFKDCRFSYSVFIRTYFHRCKFERCEFIGVRVNDSSFRSATFIDCTFNYATFRNTVIPTGEILSNAPSEFNIKRDLMEVLRVNATSMGDYESVNSFIRAELEATRLHNRATREALGNYYGKYAWSRNKWKWLEARKDSFVFWLNGFVWGHGEYPWKLARFLAIFLAVLTFFVLFSIGTSLDKPVYELLTDVKNASVYTVSSFVGVPTPAGVGPVRTPLLWIVVLTRYIAVSLFVTMLFRRITRR